MTLPFFTNKIKWLINLRWIAALMSLAAVLFFYLLGFHLNWTGLIVVSLIILVMNSIYTLVCKQFDNGNKDHSFIEKYIFIQITLDYILLTIWLHFAGSIENPMIVLYIFHMVLGAILLRRRNSFIQTTFALFSFALLVLFEQNQYIQHYTINEYIALLLMSSKEYLIFAFGVFFFTAYSVVYLVSKMAKEIIAKQEALFLSYEQLEVKDKIKEEYVLRLTHDIRGHIAAIKSNVDVLYHKVFGDLPEQYHSYVNTATSRIEKLGTFIIELLNLTQLRLENKVVKQAFPLIDMVNEMVIHHSDFSTSRNIQVEVINHAENTVVFADITSIKEVLSNLIENGIKYTPEGGRVEIVLKQQGDKLLIKVKDNGVGIPADELKHVFTEFYRATNIRVSVMGTGIGMSIVKQIIDAHNETISIDSEVNKGTTITFTLTLAQ